MTIHRIAGRMFPFYHEMEAHPGSALFQPRLEFDEASRIEFVLCWFGDILAARYKSYGDESVLHIGQLLKLMRYAAVANILQHGVCIDNLEWTEGCGFQPKLLAQHRSLTAVAELQGGNEYRINFPEIGDGMAYIWVGVLQKVEA